jgi:outer membrane biosynthesis protein TonB
VSQPINLEDGYVLKPPSTNSEGAISNGEGEFNNGTQLEAELSPITPGGAPRAGFSTTRAKTAVFALAGACAVLFGASFAAATLTGGDEPEKAGPALSAPSAADIPSGRSLDLGGAARLPGLREQPSLEPAVPRPVSAASAHVPEPASSSEPEPAAPPPEPVSSPEPAAPAPEPVAPAPQPVPPEPQAVVSPEPQPGTQPSRPAPQPAQPAPIEVYDSGG